MTVREFIKRWNNKFLDFDTYYGYQCMDLVQKYNQEVVKGIPLKGNAVDIWNTYPKMFYKRVENTPTNYPAPGDVIIWSQGVGPYGHIAVCISADVKSFVSFDQNWPLNSKCHSQPHNYKNVLGWIKPLDKVVY